MPKPFDDGECGRVPFGTLSVSIPPGTVPVPTRPQTATKNATRALPDDADLAEVILCAETDGPWRSGLASWQWSRHLPLPLQILKTLRILETPVGPENGRSHDSPTG